MKTLVSELSWPEKGGKGLSNWSWRGLRAEKQRAVEGRSGSIQGLCCWPGVGAATFMPVLRGLERERSSLIWWNRVDFRETLNLEQTQTWDELEFNFMLVMMEKGLARRGIIADKVGGGEVGTV